MSDMTYDDLCRAEKQLGVANKESMAMLLKVGYSTYKGWKTRDKVPDYIAASVEAHLFLTQEALEKLKKIRGLPDGS